MGPEQPGTAPAVRTIPRKTQRQKYPLNLESCQRLLQLLNYGERELDPHNLLFPEGNDRIPVLQNSGCKGISLSANKNLKNYALTASYIPSILLRANSFHRYGGKLYLNSMDR